MKTGSILLGILLATVMLISGFQGDVEAFKLLKSHKASKVGKDIHAFYNKAMEAAKKEDLKGVMDLYSKNYLSNGFTRDDVESSWKRIFEGYDSIEIEHHIYQVYDGGKRAKMVCGGAFLGKPASIGTLQWDPELTIIDSWKAVTHEFIQKDGVWKLYGNQVSYHTGEEQSPLF